MMGIVASILTKNSSKIRNCLFVLLWLLGPIASAFHQMEAAHVVCEVHQQVEHGQLHPEVHIGNSARAESALNFQYLSAQAGISELHETCSLLTDRKERNAPQAPTSHQTLNFEKYVNRTAATVRTSNITRYRLSPSLSPPVA